MPSMALSGAQLGLGVPRTFCESSENLWSRSHSEHPAFWVSQTLPLQQKERISPHW